MTEVHLRIVSAIVMLAVVIISGAFGGVWFTILCWLIGLQIFIEWCTLVEARGLSLRRRMVPRVIFATLAAGAIWAQFSLGAGRGEPGLWILVIFFTPLAGVAIWTSENNVWFPIGLVYAAALPIGAVALRQSLDPTDLQWLIAAGLLTWVSDSVAYFAGRRFGGRKLAPGLSPGKTWSGAICGLLSSVLVGVLYLMFFGDTLLISAIVIASFLAFLSQAGDLFQSALKRHFKVKNSGNFIPGHGGFMDRVDGLIPVIAAALLLREWLS